MATWKKVITESDNSTHKNESITLAQLFAGLDGDSAATGNQILKVNANHTALEWATDDDVTSLGNLTNVTGFASASNGGAILIGQDSGQYAVKAVTGDVTVNKTGAITIGDDKVTYAKMQDTSTNNRVLGAGTAGTIAEVQVATDMVADDAITYAKMQHIATGNRVLGATSAGAVTEVQVQHDMIADDAVDGDKLSNNIAIAGTLSVGSTLTVSGDLDIAGNVNTTNQTVTDLDIEDKTITLAVQDSAYLDQNAMLSATNGAGIKLQNQYTSGSATTSAADMSASLTWDKDAGLSGWKAKHYTGTANAVPIALMDFKADTGAPANTVNSGGVGSFILNTQDDELYVRVG